VTTSDLAKEISSTTLIWYYCHCKTSRSNNLTTFLVFRHKQSASLLLMLFLNTPWLTILFLGAECFLRRYRYSVKEFLAFYETRWFITTFKIPLHVPVLSQFTPIHDPQPTTWSLILIVFSHQRLSLRSCFFRSCLPMKTLNALLHSPPPRCTTCPVHVLYLITRIIFLKV